MKSRSVVRVILTFFAVVLILVGVFAVLALTEMTP